MSSRVHPRHDSSSFVRDVAQFMVPYLIQMAVIPAWALKRLEAMPADGTAELLRAGWPFLLIPVFAAAAAIWWRLDPRNSTRMTVFAGAFTGAISIAIFLVYAIVL